MSITTYTSCLNKEFKHVIHDRKSSSSLIDKIDSIIALKMKEYDIPGLSIGIVKNDRIVYTKGYGITSIQYPRPVSDTSIFHTASVSKIFTALGIMNLVQHNRLCLDDKLVKILPDLKFRDKRAEDITIKNILNHTSGIPDVRDYNWSNNNQSKNALKDYLTGQSFRLSFKPSTTYSYSNLAYDILGYVIEETSGSTFEDYIKENILQPSGMINSDFRYFAIPDTLKTSPHSKRWLSKRIYQRSVYPYTREHAPSSTLNSSSLELSKWMISFIKKLHTETESSCIRLMIQESTHINNSIGLGFQLYTVDGKKAIGHFGGDKGFRSYLLMVPDKSIGLVILANCDYHEDFRQEILHQILREIDKD